MRLEDYDTITLVKPEIYDKLDLKGAEGYFKANQQVLPWLDKLIQVGEQQLKMRTGYDENRFPESQPLESRITLDDITFRIKTTVQVANPKYADAYLQLLGYLEGLHFDIEMGRIPASIRVWERENDKASYISWDHLMGHAMRCLSSVQNLGVRNSINSIEPPVDLAESTLDRLLVPRDSLSSFDIGRSGNARLWYSARKFAAEVEEHTINALKEQMKAEFENIMGMPAETTVLWNQVENRYAFGLKAVPSPRTAWAKIMNGMFKIPENRPKGSLPIIANADNYIDLLDAYSKKFNMLLSDEKNLAGKIGGIALLYYIGTGQPERHPHIMDQFPDLARLGIRRDGDVPYICLVDLIDHLLSLGLQKKDRLLTAVVTKPIVK